MIKPNVLRMKGLSLIELMVGMVISIFLIGGLASVYMSSQSSNTMRSQISEMEENARTALHAMRQIISHAGYPSEYMLPIEKPFYAEEADIPSPACRGGGEDRYLVTYRYIKNKKTQNGGVAKRDTIMVVSMLDSPKNNSDELNGLSKQGSKIIEDCTGGDVQLQCSSDPVHGMYANSESRVYNYLYINTPSKRRALTCMGSLSDAQPIAENIENMQFLYGVAKAGTMLVYKNSKDVTDSDEWGNVISVQVGILVRSEKEILKIDESKVFLLLDEEITTTKDRRLYRAYTTTIALPNVSRSL